jgi:hypothetical protein
MQSKKMLWTGRIISALVILFLVADSVGKVMKLAPYLEGTVLWAALFLREERLRALIPLRK